MQIWDTAGQERFRSMTPMYYRSATAAILVYDITSFESFESVKNWVKELRTNVSNDVVLAIVGNKCDLEDQRQIRKEKAEAYVATVDSTIFQEISAKDNKGIEDLFNNIAKKLVELQERQQVGFNGAAANVSINPTNFEKDVNSKCC